MKNHRSIQATMAAMLSIFLLMALPTAAVFAADSGLTPPTTYTTGTAGSSWGTPENGLASDDLYATAAQSGRWVSYSGFTFSFPPGSIINGIEVSLEGYSPTRQANIDLSWDGGTTYTTGAGTGVKTTAFTGSDAVHAFGGPTDSWGNAHTWTLSDFAGSPNTTFRVRLTAGTGTGNIFVDQVQVRIYYTVSTFTLSYTAGPNGSITGDSPQTVNYGGSGTAVTAVADPGYHFVNWSDSSTDNPRTDTNVTNDVTVTANFAIDQFTLTYTAGPNGSITGDSPQTVNYGGSGTAVTAVADPGYHFVDWSDSSTDNPRTDTNVTHDVTVTANFAIDVTYSIGGNAGVGGATISYTGGSTTADGTGHYAFTVLSGWSGTVTPSKPGYRFIPDHREYTNVTTDWTDQNYTATDYWSTNPWYGSVAITADRSVVAVGRPHVGAEVASYDGVSSGSLTAYVPMLFKNAWGSYNAALYVQNVDAIHTADITVKFYDSTGNLTCELPDTVAPLASKGYWIPSQSCLPSGWVGGAVITSDYPIVTVGRPHVGTQVMTYNGFSSGALSAYLPMLFKHAWGAYDAAFYVQNVDSDPAHTASISIKYYDSTGNLTCEAGDTVAPLASKGYWVPSQSCLPDGWVGGAVVTSDYPIVTIGRPHVGAEVTSYSGFSGGSGSMYVPMLFKGAFGGSYNAAFYVQNVDPNPLHTATISIKYYDSAGNLTCEAGDTVSALASKGYWVPSQSCLPAGWVGGAVVTSNYPIVAVGRPHVGTQVTTYPGIASGSTNLYLPMLFKNMWGSYNSAFYVQNTDTLNPANVTLKFYDMDGNLSCTRSDSIPAKATLGYWVPSVSCDP
jgi:hypothetical protein